MARVRNEPKYTHSPFSIFVRDCMMYITSLMSKNLGNEIILASPLVRYSEKRLKFLPTRIIIRTCFVIVCSLPPYRVRKALRSEVSKMLASKLHFSESQYFFPI